MVCRMSVFVFATLLGCLFGGGCAASQPPKATSRVALPEISAARALRASGSLYLEKAYAAIREVDREVNFRKAESEFDRAMATYNQALTSSGGLYEPTIELEIGEVMEHLRQLRRDRKSPA